MVPPRTRRRTQWPYGWGRSLSSPPKAWGWRQQGAQYNQRPSLRSRFAPYAGVEQPEGQGRSESLIESVGRNGSAGPRTASGVVAHRGGLTRPQTKSSSGRSHEEDGAPHRRTHSSAAIRSCRVECVPSRAQHRVQTLTRARVCPGRGYVAKSRRTASAVAGEVWKARTAVSVRGSGGAM